MRANIELRHLRYILAVAEERNFTRAAARCHVSQSALSRQILEVEKDLGTKLLERQFTPKSTRLTQAGVIFEHEARRAVEHCRRAVSQVQALATAEMRPLQLGVSALLDIPYYFALLGTAHRSVKENSMQIRSAYTRNLVGAVLRGVLEWRYRRPASQVEWITSGPVGLRDTQCRLPRESFICREILAVYSSR